MQVLRWLWPHDEGVPHSEMTEMGLQEVYFAMYDVEAAFRQIRIHPDDWIYLVVAWQRTKNGEREWYIDLALPFGVVV
ncbi:MAG: hypothetical protein JW384_02551 [Nitrosomonadaceae bacterium]|nr:hypothetical protein [Nitrosomonadaceae bacterium]